MSGDGKDGAARPQHDSAPRVGEPPELGLSSRPVGSAGVTLTRLRRADFQSALPPLPEFTFSILIAGRSRPWRDIGDGLKIPKGAEAYRHQGGGILTPRDTSSVWRVEGQHDCLIFSFPTDVIEKTLADTVASSSNALDRVTDRVVHDPLFAAVATALWQQAEDEFGSAFGDHAVALVLTRLARESRSELLDDPRASPREKLSSRSLRQAMDFMRANVANDPTLDSIALAAGLSAYHFLRAFKATTGRTPFQWLFDFRIEVACGLLAATPMPLAEIALQVGFKNQSHFTVAFRKAMGTTPARFRAEVSG